MTPPDNIEIDDLIWDIKDYIVLCAYVQCCESTESCKKSELIKKLDKNGNYNIIKNVISKKISTLQSSYMNNNMNPNKMLDEYSTPNLGRDQPHGDELKRFKSKLGSFENMLKSLQNNIHNNGLIIRDIRNKMLAYHRDFDRLDTLCEES